MFTFSDATEMNPVKPERTGWYFLLLLIATLGGGCETYVQQNSSAAGAWVRGDVQGASAQYASMARRSARGRDAVIWHLEEGAALRAAGQFRESNAALAAAEGRIDEYERRAKISVSDEALALVSNQATLPYEGRIYDKVMLNSYRALNYLQLADVRAARVEFNRVLRRQEDAIATKRRRLDREQRAIASAKQSGHRAAPMIDSKQVQSKLTATYAFLDKYKAQGSYKNPYALFLRGLFFATQATGNADLETARHAYTEAGANTSNRYLSRELQRIEDRFAGKPLAPLVHVIFETGRAPRRIEERIDLPLILVGEGNVPYVGLAFPVLHPQYNYVSALNVQTGGKTEQTQLLADMDAIIGKEFADELPIVIAKTILSSAAKAIAAYSVNRAAQKQDNDLQFLTAILTSAYQAAVNRADTRTWTTLPKQIQYCSIELPSNRTVKLSGGGINSEIKLQSGNTILLYVKSISPSAPLLVTQTTLN